MDCEIVMLLWNVLETKKESRFYIQNKKWTPKSPFSERRTLAMIVLLLGECDGFPFAGSVGQERDQEIQ